MTVSRHNPVTGQTAEIRHPESGNRSETRPDNNLYTGYLFTGCNGHHDGAGLPGSQADITGKAKVPVKTQQSENPALSETFGLNE